MYLLISVNSKNVVETTISAVATCVFQIMPVKGSAGTQAAIFDEALALIRKIQELQGKSSQMALYTAAREYLESVRRMSENRINASTALKSSSAEGDENWGGTISISEEVETFSRTVVLEILASQDFGSAHDLLRQALVKMVLAFVRQSPPASTSTDAVAARGKLSTILTEWRVVERSRPLQKDLDEALEANQKAANGARGELGAGHFS